MLVPNKFWVQKDFGSQKIFGYKNNFWSKNVGKKSVDPKIKSVDPIIKPQRITIDHLTPYLFIQDNILLP